MSAERQQALSGALADVPLRALVEGDVRAVPLVLGAALSLWGGLDPADGTIVDARHPQSGASVARRLLVMPAVRGSSSSSSVLAEALRLGVGPAGILLGAPDGILVAGALVARELYGTVCPMALVGDGRIAEVVAALGAHGRLRLRVTDVAAQLLAD